MTSRAEGIPPDAAGLRCFFNIPKAAAAALDKKEIAARATAAGFPLTRYEENDRSAPHGMTRISTNKALAAIITHELAQLSQLSNGDLAVWAAEGVSAGLKALGEDTNAHGS